MTSTAPSAIVVGGGPGGLMAAEVLAANGCRVVVHEHRSSVGRKFLLAGRSGLNLTNDEPVDSLVHRYGSSGPRLETALHTFSPDDLRDWAEGLGERSFIGSGGRVFPDSLRATPLLRAWLARLNALGVEFATNSRFRGWDHDDLVFEAHDVIGRVRADIVVFALGGASWPRVGSDGGWVEPFTEAGVAVTPLRASNCGVLIPWSDHFVSNHEGLPVKNVSVTVDDHTVRGDLTVTRTGLEGGAVYAHSSALRRQLDEHGRATMLIDLLPDQSMRQAVERLGRRRPKDSTSNALRRAFHLSPTTISFVRETRPALLPSASSALVALLKELPVTIDGLAGIDRAISSSGGVAFDQVDDDFMLVSRPGTYVVGEMLDWDAPTGGYLLQATFSTAVAAARAALRRTGAVS